MVHSSSNRFGLILLPVAFVSEAVLEAATARGPSRCC